MIIARSWNMSVMLLDGCLFCSSNLFLFTKLIHKPINSYSRHLLLDYIFMFGMEPPLHILWDLNCADHYSNTLGFSKVDQSMELCDILCFLIYLQFHFICIFQHLALLWNVTHGSFGACSIYSATVNDRIQNQRNYFS